MKLNYKKIFKNARPLAKEVFKDKKKFNKVIDESMELTKDKNIFLEFTKELGILFSLSKDYLKGNYKNVKNKDILMVIAGLLYLLNPADIVPDFIVGIGFIDDLSVITYVFSKLKKILDDYEEWKNNYSNLSF
ncbi:uncharacterized membrane protein YkvA (DUF1232 family) [Peptoniphilus olsenii]|uniref:Uncharacterized membrane protein YkvA (DUF1232 family) n=1 Tax=Peptoniphilus olsenii TaxID=411570 RepID=A0ABV2J9C8_9FIRM